LVSTAFAVSGAMQACGGDNNPTDGGPGDGTVPDAKPDHAQLPDTGGPDAAPPVTPAGSELASSDQVQIFGVTSDDDVIYADGSTPGLFAVPSGGGTAVKIGAPSTYILGIAGADVFVWASVTTNSVGALSVWHHGGTLTAVPNATLSSPNAFGASPDGTHILFTTNANTAGTVANIVGANLDGTNQSTLVTSSDIAADDCRPLVGFASNSEAVTSTCATAPGDGGVPSASVTTYAIADVNDAGTTWTPAAILATGALDFWSTDTAGDQIMVATTLGTSVYPIGGGVPVVIDTKNIYNAVGAADFTFGLLDKAGTNVLYSTAAGELDTAAVSLTPGVAAVQATGAKFIRAISPDQNYTIYTTNFDSQLFGGDLYLTKNLAASSAATLSNVTTSALFGVSSQDDFTADSSRVMWIEALDTTSGTGDLYAQAVASGTPAKIASGVWQNASATGTKIIYNNNCASCSGSGGTTNAQGDLYVADVSTTTAPTLLQAQVDIPLSASSSIYFDKAKTHVIYTYSLNTTSTGVPASGGNGLYAVAIP
jgi:hypothetical protein